MKKAVDRKKRRQEYVKQKGKAFTRAAFFGLGTVAATLGCFYCLALIVLTEEARYGVRAVVCGCIAGVCHHYANRAEYHANDIPYVPPITANTLPADEILVRGSEEPPITPSEELLRATQPGQETPKEELLHTLNR